MDADGTDTLRVLGESAYPASLASARVRVRNYQPYLSSEGIALDFRSTLSDEQYAGLASDASVAQKAAIVLSSAARSSRGQSDHDVLLLHRLRLPMPFPGLDPPRRIDVYDFDDALFLGSPGQVNRRYQRVRREAERWRSYTRRARLVMAGNSFLASSAREYARRVEIVPTVVDPERQMVHIHEPNPTVTIGWIGSRSTVEYLRPLLPVLRTVAQNQKARVVVVGGDTGVREDWIEHVPWSLEAEPLLLASFDIGIMPLPDTDWARGKCGYKILQYFSAGVPAVASPVGVAASLVSAERGRLARSDGEWRSALQELIGEHEMRREQGWAARRFVEQEYSYSRWAPELGAMLKSLVG